jgi:hypothetical protein
VERIVELVPPAGGGVEEVATDEDVHGMASGWSVCFDDLPSEDFVQTVIILVFRSVYSSKQRIISHLGARIDFSIGARFFFRGWASRPADDPILVAW